MVHFILFMSRFLIRRQSTQVQIPRSWLANPRLPPPRLNKRAALLFLLLPSARLFTPFIENTQSVVFSRVNVAPRAQWVIAAAKLRPRIRIQAPKLAAGDQNKYKADATSAIEISSHFGLAWWPV